MLLGSRDGARPLPMHKGPHLWQTILAPGDETTLSTTLVDGKVPDFPYPRLGQPARPTGTTLANVTILLKNDNGVLRTRMQSGPNTSPIGPESAHTFQGKGANGEAYTMSFQVTSKAGNPLLGTERTTSDSLFVEVEGKKRTFYIARGGGAQIPITGSSLKYSGGTMAVPEGANLLVISRSLPVGVNGQTRVDNSVTWRFYQASPQELALREHPHMGVIFGTKGREIKP